MLLLLLFYSLEEEMDKVCLFNKEVSVGVPGRKVDGADWSGCVVLVGGQGCKDRRVLCDERPSMNP